MSLRAKALTAVQAVPPKAEATERQTTELLREPSLFLVMLLSRRTRLDSIERQFDQTRELDGAVDWRLFSRVEFVGALDSQEHCETVGVLDSQHIEKDAIASGRTFGGLHVDGDRNFTDRVSGVSSKTW